MKKVSASRSYRIERKQSAVCYRQEREDKQPAKKTSGPNAFHVGPATLKVTTNG